MGGIFVSEGAPHASLGGCTALGATRSRKIAYAGAGGAGGPASCRKVISTGAGPGGMCRGFNVLPFG